MVDQNRPLRLEPIASDITMTARCPHGEGVGVRIASFVGAEYHPAYPLSTLRCVPRGSSARLEAERIATPCS